MTLVGLLSDAHGNPLGLRTCLDVLKRAGAQQLYFLGDAVGYLPGEAAVLDLLARENVHCQWGNHEAMLLGELALDPDQDQMYGIAAVGVRLSGKHRAQLDSWPRTRTLTLDGRRILLVHGSPTDPLCAYVYPDADLSGLASLGFDAVFMGNTHRPFVTRCDAVWWATSVPADCRAIRAISRRVCSSTPRGVWPRSFASGCRLSP